ncbi:Alpha/Beta hydrolase protein [Scleroderma yunnanense]
MPSAQFEALAPYAEFAHAAYCSPNVDNGLKCSGDACTTVSDFQMTLAGGDDNVVQYFYVGYWPTQNSIVVAHQGTDFSKLMPVLTDAGFLLGPLDPDLFPGIGLGVLVHIGFAQEHARTAPTILAEVKRLLSEHPTASVTLVGHSLGGALAELDCLFMTLNLPSGTPIKGVTFGTPRVGDLPWATLFDSKVKDFQRINNMHDIIPTLPPPVVGYSHVRGEVHIVRPGYVVECPGDDDVTDEDCTNRTDMLGVDFNDHWGPYVGIYIGSDYCS